MAPMWAVKRKAEAEPEAPAGPRKRLEVPRPTPTQAAPKAARPTPPWASAASKPRAAPTAAAALRPTPPPWAPGARPRAAAAAAAPAASAPQLLKAVTKAAAPSKPTAKIGATALGARKGAVAATPVAAERDGCAGAGGSGSGASRSGGVYTSVGSVAIKSTPLGGNAPKPWARREPFQRVFLDAPEEASEEDHEAIVALRDELQIIVEDEQGPCVPPIVSFEELGSALPAYIIEALAGQGIDAPMPIQAQAVPLVLSGHNLVGIAKTGSGKTLAYLLPAICHIEAQAPVPKGKAEPIALVLAPVRELAVQIMEEARKLLESSNGPSNHPGGMWAACAYGGGASSKSWQVAEMRRCASIVAATPGRFADLVDGGEVSLHRVTYLVFDEADRMLECGFADQVGSIAKHIRPDRQTLFFSATWPEEVQDLAARMCEAPPVRIAVGQRAEGDGPASRDDIVQEVVVFDQETWDERDAKKQELMYKHLHEVLASDEHKALVFVSRKDLCNDMVTRLWKEGISADSMHGGRTQEMRLEVLDGFKNGGTKLLVTTDVMGRGLDIPDISHVVIYDMGDIEDYVHRIGRTARGPYGQGHALTLFEYDRKWPALAGKLLEVLEASGQEAPEDLRTIAEEVEQGLREVAPPPVKKQKWKESWGDGGDGGWWGGGGAW